LKFRVGSRVFTPSWLAVGLTLLCVSGLSSLGFWQLRRADEKRELMTQAEQGRQHTLRLTAATAPGLRRYQHVIVAGSFDAAHQLLLDNMPSSQGAPGYRVLTPLQLADQSVLLVDRGWVTMGENRQQRPAIDVTTQPRELTGMIDELPRPGVRAGNAGIQATVWPQLLNYPTWQELQQLYGPRLQSRMVLLDVTAADGFERRWQIDLGFTPERHIGYAVQWFGMAFTLLIIFFIVNLQRDQT
jgi:surfeit locus 1 family protein